MQNAKVQTRKRSRGEFFPFSDRAMEPAVRPPLLATTALLTLALCVLHSAFFPLSVLADIQSPPKAGSKGERQLQRRTPPPPTPVATTVRLQPGGTAEIVLQANGALGKFISFLLRTPPAHGAFVGTPRRIGRDSMAVTYVHRAADGASHDSFTFAVQAPGTAVSAAETVDIEIVGPASDAGPASNGLPDLAANPPELDFGAVEMGNSTGATLTVENRGGGLASGRLVPPAPWAVNDDDTYSLGRGGRQTFRVVFRPQHEGSFAETLRIDAGNSDSKTGCVVRLVGTGLPAVARAPLTTPTPTATPAAIPEVAEVSPTPAPSASPLPVRRASSTTRSLPEIADPGTVVTNEAQVTAVRVLAVGSSTVELAWKPPTPLPRAYRIERRSIAYDEREQFNVRVDWLPDQRTDFRVHADEVTAKVRGLRSGEPVALRVVTVDSAGQLSQPSPTVDVITARPRRGGVRRC